MGPDFNNSFKVLFKVTLVSNFIFSFFNIEIQSLQNFLRSKVQHINFSKRKPFDTFDSAFLQTVQPGCLVFTPVISVYTRSALV